MYYLNLDTSNQNDLNENQENNHDTPNKGLGEGESFGGVLNGDQNRISILQSYDSYPDGDKIGLFNFIYFYKKFFYIKYDCI